MKIDEKYQERVLKLGEICALRSKLISMGDSSYTDVQALKEIKPILSEAFESRNKLNNLEKLSDELGKRVFGLVNEKRDIYSSREARKILIQVRGLERKYKLGAGR